MSTTYVKWQMMGEGLPLYLYRQIDRWVDDHHPPLQLAGQPFNYLSTIQLRFVKRHLTLVLPPFLLPSTSSSFYTGTVHGTNHFNGTHTQTPTHIQQERESHSLSTVLNCGSQMSWSEFGWAEISEKRKRKLKKTKQKRERKNCSGQHLPSRKWIIMRCTVN